MTKESDHAGTAICQQCGTHAQLYITDQGLRCEDCRTETSPTSSATYTPRLRAQDESRPDEALSNLEEFEETLPDIQFSVEMQDGSTYDMDKWESAAVLLKVGEQWQSFLTQLARKVAEHYEKQTEPTKFVDYAAWGSSNHDKAQDSYDSHAALAPVVAYSILRPALMQLSLMGMSDADDSVPSVVAIGDEKLTKYTENGSVTVDFEQGDNE